MKNACESDVSLSFFPQTKKLYRIDWLGNVCYPDRRASHRQPSIAVALSEVVRTNAGYKKAAPNQRQLQRFAPVGLLSWLRIGDIWQTGRRIDCLQTVRTEFQNLQINQDSSRIIKAGADLQGKGFLMNHVEFHHHCQHHRRHHRRHPCCCQPALLPPRLSNNHRYSRNTWRRHFYRHWHQSLVNHIWRH